MADFSIIADVSAAMLKLLKEMLCPQPMQSPESIALAAPTDKNADFQLGLFLYDIKELSEYRSSDLVRGANNKITYPPRPLTLFYLAFLNSKAQIASGAQDEQRILGRVLQVLMDNPVVSIDDAHPFGLETELDASITIPNLSFEDKTKLWSSLSMPYQLGVAFTVAPVMLSSNRSDDIIRVIHTEFETSSITSF